MAIKTYIAIEKAIWEHTKSGEKQQKTKDIDNTHILAPRW